MNNVSLGKALSVDDEKTNRLIIKSLLKKQGYDCIEAVNGQESIDLFLLIGDFTGHGLSAALGAMPVSEVFHAMVSKGFSAGMPDLLVIDGATNEVTHRIKSNSLPLGIVEDINTREIGELVVEQVDHQRHIQLRVEDSGEGFDYENYCPPEEDSIALNGRGLMLIESLCESLSYEGKGNIAKASFTWVTL